MTLVAELERITRRPAQNAGALPVQSYSDPDVYARELERIHRKDWIALCAAAELPNPGDYWALTLADEPIVIMRGDDGELRALSNVCTHRGTLLIDEGRGNAKKMVCPYHAWTFKSDGALLGIPHKGNADINKADRCLPQFPLEVWNGVMFVNLDMNASALAPQLRDLDALLAPYGVEKYRIPFTRGETLVWQANWKLVLANAMESYHLFKVHPETLEPGSPTKGAYYTAGSPRWTVTAGGGPKPKPSGPDALPTAKEFAKGHYLLVSVPPSFVAILRHDSWGWLAAHPMAPDRTHITGSSLIRKRGSTFAKAFGKPFMEVVDAFFEEDRLICERGQRTAKAQGARVGTLVEMERVVGDFHNYLGERLFD